MDDNEDGNDSDHVTLSALPPSAVPELLKRLNLIQNRRPLPLQNLQ